MSTLPDIIERALSHADATLNGKSAARRQLVIAYSGGLDSSALLHALASGEQRDRYDLLAIHVNHGLQQDSDDWAAFCRATAEELDVPCQTFRLVTTPAPGDSVEAWARKERYAVLTKLANPQAFIVTAHHIEDQFETFLLHLLRGAGPHGLSAIRPTQAFEGRFLIRPMLSLHKQDIEDYVAKERIRHITDPSNANLDFERNYLRHTITPLIRKRWPKATANVAHSAAIQLQLANEIERRAALTLSEVMSDDGKCILLSPLRDLSSEDRFWVIRRWCVQKKLGLPERRHAGEIEKAIFAKAPKATLLICWKDAELRYYDDRLFLRRRVRTNPTRENYSWNMMAALKLPDGELKAVESKAGELALRLRGSECEVGFYRRKGERCRPSTKQHSQSLKKLFQQWRVPPWERDRVPIVWIDGKIAAVIPYCVCEQAAARDGEPGLVLEYSEFAQAE